MTNSMIKTLVALALLGASATSSFASVTVSANAVSQKILDASGNALPSGDVVRIGYFSDTSLLGSSNDFTYLNSIFTPIGEGLANAGTLTESGNTGQTMIINNFGGNSGAFLGSFSNVSGTYLAPGTQLYMWVFNASLASVSSATQWGIFSASSWTFPSDLGSVTVSPSTGGVNVIRGGTSGSNFTIASVPEPSTYALLGLGTAFAGWMARRKKA